MTWFHQLLQNLKYYIGFPVLSYLIDKFHKRVVPYNQAVWAVIALIVGHNGTFLSTLWLLRAGVQSHNNLV